MGERIRQLDTNLIHKMFNNTIITKLSRSPLRVLSIVLVIALLSLNAAAQNGEQVVILWDVTGSLLPQQTGTIDLDGKTKIPTFKNGNGMWVPLKKAIIECIEYTEASADTEIAIVTFNDGIRDVFSQKATNDGKQHLIDYVTNYKYKRHKFTNIVAGINEFYDLLGKNKTYYMFLFTDGENDDPATSNQFIPVLKAWTNNTKGQDVYGFYVLVHPDADKQGIRSAVESQNNFWIVNDSRTRIKNCSLPSSIKYSIRDEAGPKTISLKGKYAIADGEVQLVANDDYYDVVCSDLDIKDGKIDIEIKPREGIVPPESHTFVLTPQLSGADQYTFIGPQEISLTVLSIPDRSLDLTIDNRNFGKAVFYDSFLFAEGRSTPAKIDIKVEFSEQAKIENSSAVMKVYFVDRKTEQKVSSAAQHLSISIDGKELSGDSFTLTPEMSDVILSISGQPETETGTYYGRIELLPSNLDNYSINGTPEVFKWKMSFSQNWNPLKLSLAWLLGILAAAFLLWMFILKPIFYPRFGSIQKTFNIPGMAPLIVWFKGARMVVVAASHQKKQSGWNRFWIGKILYKTHPAFVAPITFKPIKDHRILARVQAGTYRVMPNPMPGIGAATIIDMRTNLQINVN